MADELAEGAAIYGLPVAGRHFDKRTFHGPDLHSANLTDPALTGRPSGRMEDDATTASVPGGSLGNNTTTPFSARANTQDGYTFVTLRSARSAADEDAGRAG